MRHPGMAPPACMCCSSGWRGAADAARPAPAFRCPLQSAGRAVAVTVEEGESMRATAVREMREEPRHRGGRGRPRPGRCSGGASALRHQPHRLLPAGAGLALGTPRDRRAAQVRRPALVCPRRRRRPSWVNVAVRQRIGDDMARRRAGDSRCRGVEALARLRDCRRRWGRSAGDGPTRAAGASPPRRR